MRRLSLPLGLVLLLLTAAPAAAVDGASLEPVGSFDSPLFVTAPAGDDRLFVVERPGRVVVRQPGGATSTFLDVSGRTTTDGERGLLGLAFAPDYAQSGELYVALTDASDGALLIERYRVSSDPDRAAAGSRQRILRVPQPFPNHNGGMIAFGPDDNLYVGLGDGGGSGDPNENAQDPSTLLGSILRLDVSGGGADYAVPADNPYVGRAGRDEIWIIGLRNPWRFSFDAETGDLWIGDVGQNSVEEVDRIPFAPSRAFNLGWDRYEGSQPYEDAGSSSGLTFPVYEYSHDLGQSVTGGYVYRGDRVPTLRGRYVFGDFAEGWIRTLDGGSVSGSVTLFDEGAGALGLVSGFGTDGDGELYVTSIAGGVSRFVSTLDIAGFSDIDPDSPFIDQIQTLVDAAITQGCAEGRYCPTDAVTRLEMAAFLRRADDLPRSPEPFADVADDGALAPDVGAIFEDGITNGCATDPLRFCPSQDVTRAEMAAFLARALDLDPVPSDFDDVADGSTFDGAIGAIADEGITTGCEDGTVFCPADPVTRAEMAAFLVRAFDPGAS